MDPLQNMLRTIMFFLDNIIYDLISKAYELIAYLANVNIFSNDLIQDLIGRVYLLLGVFMLFKVSFSVLQYIIDPNSMSDSAKGVGKLTTNVLVALFLLVSVPAIFSFAFNLQNKIVTSNVIPNLIMGTASSGALNVVDEKNNFAKQAANMARDVQFIMFGAFYRLNTDENHGGIVACQADVDNPSKDVFGSRDMASSEACLSALDTAMSEEGPVKSRGINLGDFFKQLKRSSAGDNVIGTVVVDNEEYKVVDNRNFAAFDSMLWWKIDGKPEYAINYTPIISTFTGAYVLILLITFCIDIGTRAIKLCFLQMIAPIAIVSHIDPKESASQGKLNNWAKECLKTFFSLFLRLATIFLALKLVQVVTDLMLSPEGLYGKDVNDVAVVPPDSMNIWIILFLILGIFTFAKQAPKIIEGIFGIKMSGEMNLNPFKNQAFSALSGTAMGTLGGAVAGYKAGASSGRKLQGAAAGLFSGGAHGFSNHDKKNSFGNAMQHAYKDLSGNELARMSLAQGILKPTGKTQVSEVKSALTNAYHKQDQLNSQLDIAKSKTKAAYESLKNEGIDITTKEGRAAAASHPQPMESAVREAMQKRHDTVSKLAGKPFEDETKKLEKQLKNDEMARNIKAYNNSAQAELDIRGNLGKLTADIATLNEEAGQRKKFHNYDDSSKEKVDELLSAYKDPKDNLK